MVDLLRPFQKFQYYHPGQHGSASIKVLLPLLAGKEYSMLEIGNGDTARREFLRVTYSPVDDAERQRVRQALLGYCSLDTRGMIDIVQKLKELVQD